MTNAEKIKAQIKTLNLQLSEDEKNLKTVNKQLIDSLDSLEEINSELKSFSVNASMGNYVDITEALEMLDVLQKDLISTQKVLLKVLNTSDKNLDNLETEDVEVDS